MTFATVGLANFPRCLDELTDVAHMMSAHPTTKIGMRLRSVAFLPHRSVAYPVGMQARPAPMGMRPPIQEFWSSETGKPMAPAFSSGDAGDVHARMFPIENAARQPRKRRLKMIVKKAVAKPAPADADPALRWAPRSKGAETTAS